LGDAKLGVTLLDVAAGSSDVQLPLASEMFLVVICACSGSIAGWGKLKYTVTFSYVTVIG